MSRALFQGGVGAALLCSRSGADGEVAARERRSLAAQPGPLPALRSRTFPSNDL